MVFLTLASCSKSKDIFTLKDDSKVLATVEGKDITKQQVDIIIKTSFLSEKEIIEKLIDNELLFIKSKELKISVTDDETKAEVQRNRDLIEKADNKEEAKAIIEDVIKILGITEEGYWDTYAIQAYKRTLIIGKTKQKLGSDTDETLKLLREKAKIEYFN
jgi:hypothetical protein